MVNFTISIAVQNQVVTNSYKAGGAVRDNDGVLNKRGGILNNSSKKVLSTCLVGSFHRARSSCWLMTLPKLGWRSKNRIVQLLPMGGYATRWLLVVLTLLTQLAWISSAFLFRKKCLAGKPALVRCLHCFSITDSSWRVKCYSALCAMWSGWGVPFILRVRVERGTQNSFPLCTHFLQCNPEWLSRPPGIHPRIFDFFGVCTGGLVLRDRIEWQCCDKIYNFWKRRISPGVALPRDRR